MKKLSICIPTYNRIEYLQNLLNEIYEQIEIDNLYDYIEVLVSNNNSPDGTDVFMNTFEKINLKYFKQEINIGPDANFLFLFEQAKGEYIWLPGDDDTIRQDTISFMLNSMKKYNFDYLYLRGLGETILDANLRDSFEVSNVELLQRVNIYTTFMTSQVIRADLIKKYIKESRKYLGGYMAYYYIFLQSLSDSKKCLISKEKEVFANSENTGGYKFYKVWGENVLDSFVASSFGSNKLLLNLFKNRMFYKLIIPVTVSLNSKDGNFFFDQEENPLPILRKYYDRSIELLILRIYLNYPKFRTLLYVFIRLYNKYIKHVNNEIT